MLLLKKITCHPRIWIAPIVAIHITGKSCISRRSFPIPTPTAAAIDAMHPGKNKVPLSINSLHAAAGSSPGDAREDPTSTLPPSDPTSTLPPSDPTSTLPPSDPTSTLPSSCPASTLPSSSDPFAGIPNIKGRSCFMNAPLQIIAALYAAKIQPDSSLRKLIDEINNSRNPLDVERMKEFFEGLKSEYKTGSLHCMIASNQQEDAEEFITLFNDEEQFLEELSINSTHNPCVSPYVYNLMTCSSSQEADMNELIKGRPDKPVEWDCKRCNDLLCISYRRVVPERGATSQKVQTKIKGAMEISLTKNENSDLKFALKGFIVHIGSSSQNGHYIAYVKRNGTWYEANDAVITEMQEPEVEKQSEDATLFFYKKQ